MKTGEGGSSATSQQPHKPDSQFAILPVGANSFFPSWVWALGPEITACRFWSHPIIWPSPLPIPTFQNLQQTPVLASQELLLITPL